MLDRVVERLRDEFVQHGCPEHFERLKVFLLAQSEALYAALGREMNTSEGALKVAIHRLRKRYRDLFRQEIADTPADPGMDGKGRFGYRCEACGTVQDAVGLQGKGNLRVARIGFHDKPAEARNGVPQTK